MIKAKLISLILQKEYKLKKLKNNREFIHSTIKQKNKKLLKNMAEAEQGCISKQLDYIIEEYAAKKGYKSG